MADDPVGEVLAAPLRAGEPVTDVRLVGARADDGQPGLVAVPVRLPDPGMVALLDVGDRIDVVATDPQEGGATWWRLTCRCSRSRLPTTGAARRAARGGWSWSAPRAAQVDRCADAAVRSFVTYTWPGR